MEDAVIISSVRTPIGAFGGALSSVSAVDLGAIVIAESLKRANLEVSDIDEVIMGNVLSVGLGMNVARQSAIKAGIPVSTPAMTINKMCGSGLKAIILAAQAVRCGDADVVVAGGTENMSQSPFLKTYQSRFGGKSTNSDALINSISCPVNQYHMGITAENVANKYQLKPEKQSELFKTLFLLEPTYFKMSLQQISQPSKNRLLSIDYKNYQTVDGKILPNEIEINAVDKEHKNRIEIEYNSVEFNRDVSFPYSIPSGFKQVEIK